MKDLFLNVAQPAVEVTGLSSPRSSCHCNGRPTRCSRMSVPAYERRKSPRVCKQDCVDDCNDNGRSSRCTLSSPCLVPRSCME